MTVNVRSKNAKGKGFDPRLIDSVGLGDACFRLEVFFKIARVGGVDAYSETGWSNIGEEVCKSHLVDDCLTDWVTVGRRKYLK